MLARCARCQNTFTTERFGVQTCPHCGSEVLLADPNAPAAPPPPGPPGGTRGGPPPPPWGPLPPPSGAPPPPEEPAPFARRAELGWLTAFGRTWKLAALDPQRFFRTVRVDQTGAAVLFGVVAYTLGQWIQAAYGYLLVGAAMQGVLEWLMGRFPGGQVPLDPAMLRFVAGATLAGFLTRVVLAPVYAVVTLYAWAGVIHVMLLILRGAPRGFDATLTVVGYGLGVTLVAALPVPGLAFLAAAVWLVAVVILGLAEAQRCGAGKAAAATLAPGALLCLCCCGGVSALLASFSGLLRQRGDVTL